MEKFTKDELHNLQFRPVQIAQDIYKDNGMGRTCSTRWKETSTQTKQKNIMGLRCRHEYRRKTGLIEMWCEVWTGYCLVQGSCEHGNEHSDSIMTKTKQISTSKQNPPATKLDKKYDNDNLLG
jgi:hypothetical protein